MGIFSKLTFWKKKRLPDLPDSSLDSLPPLDSRPPLEQSFPQEPRFEDRIPPSHQFEDPIQQPIMNNTNNEFQVVSSKLDVINAKLEVLNERIANLEKNLNDARVKW
jgi:hypothetical protein